jgi:ribosomal protein S12 methylthiotransferase accessory factor
MRLVTTYLNERIELLDAVYSSEQHDQLHALLRLYNRVLGPVKSVNLLRPELLDLSIYSAGCTHVPIGSLMRDLMVKERGSDRIPIPGGGKGATMLASFLGAFGEMAERLLAVLHFNAVFDRLEYATYENLVRQGHRALGPHEMPLFAPEQYARPKFCFLPFRPDTLLGWIEGSELLTGCPILVPAQLALLYYKLHPAEQPIGFSTSAGLAFHTSRRHAILHGLYEVVERDGINVHWYSRISPPRVDVNLTDFLATHLNIRWARMSTPYLIQGVQIFLNTLDTPIPALTAMVVDRSRQERAFQGGSGASSQREWALAQALFEIGQSQTAFRLDDPFGRPPVHADSDVSELTAFFDAPLYFGHASNLPQLSWYTASERVVPWEAVPTFRFDNEAEEYEATMDWLRAAGIRPIVLDFNGACWPGMSVTKVLVPQPTQACIPSHPFLGHPRFYELPQRMGMADRVLEFRDLNPDPIPFP